MTNYDVYPQGGNKYLFFFFSPVSSWVFLFPASVHSGSEPTTNIIFRKGVLSLSGS